MPALGHNGGPTMEPGQSWRAHCWTKARAGLLPHMPIEVLRGRIRRAKELGLEYKTYAGVRATTGHDLVAFLFSSNALRVMRPGDALPQDRADRLAALERCARIGLTQVPLTVPALMAASEGCLDTACRAPAPFASFSQTRRILREALGKIPPDTVLLIGDTALEREWCAAGRLAGWLPAERFFAPQVSVELSSHA